MKSLASGLLTSLSRAADHSGLILRFFCLTGTLEGLMLSGWLTISGEMPVISVCIQANTSRLRRRKSISCVFSSGSSWEPILSILSRSCLSTVTCSMASMGSVAASSSSSLRSSSLKGSLVYLRGGAFLSCYASEFLMQRTASTPLLFSLFRFSRSSIT